MPVVDANETFDKYTIINRQGFATHLANFLKTKQAQGYVINLNAEWGSGKTTFLQCWHNQLSQRHPVIYFNAWESDFSKDPMLALVDCFQDQLSNSLSDNKKLITDFLEKGSYFIRKSIPNLAVAALKHKVGLSNDESFLADITDTLPIEITEQECSDGLKDVLKSLCEQRKKVDGIKEFKAVLEQMATELIRVHEQSESPKEYPIYVLVDELDRCRPNYAIEVIESIKHFFDTKRFVFVLATDTEQLQHSIKAIYGYDFDAYSYLSRFFHRTVTLPPPSTEQYLKAHLQEMFRDELNLNGKYLMEMLVSMFEWHNMTSLREMNKVLQDLELVKTSEKQFRILPLILLSILRRKHQRHYSNFVKNRLMPYKGSTNGSKLEEHLPINNAIQSLSINDTHNLKVQLDVALFFTLHSCNAEQPDIPFISLDTLQSASYNDGVAVKTICAKYTVNTDYELANLADYICLLELAGHYEI